MVLPLPAGNREAEVMLVPFQGEKSPSFPVVCIGGSAGSLAAYTDILRLVPAEAGLAIVVVSHRPIEDAKQFVQLLAKAAQMEVVEVTDGMPLKSGRVFVAPAHREMRTDGLVLRLGIGLTQHYGWPTVISDFILSMADKCASRAIAIIVSGMGHDGSSALPAIKEAGGWTVAQSDAGCMAMPQAAIRTNNVDLFLRAQEIGKYLASLSAHLGRTNG